MRCLMCGKEKGTGSLKDILFGKDPLCEECRSQWVKINYSFMLEGVPVFCPYLYEEHFSAALIQYKECGDEALKDVFLYEYRRYLRMHYPGYTLCLLPSSEKKREERGFSHLYGMFESAGMPMMEPFVKLSDVSQKKQNRLERQEMTHGIALKEGIVLPERILLCDDTVTTGSTMKGALNVLPERKVKIFALSCSRFHLPS